MACRYVAKLTRELYKLHKQSDHHESEAASVDWNSTPAQEWTGKKAEEFWDWFLEANKISKHDFFKELKVDNNSTNALERIFAKMNKSATTRGKKGRSAKGGRKL